MKAIGLVILAIVVILGCARVRVEAPKEPIKVDITMRLDVYQHVVKDINNIEDLVSGASSAQTPADKQSRSFFFAAAAYAQEGLSPDVEQAALRRKDRRQQL
jgi:hypothetical protein